MKHVRELVRQRRNEEEGFTLIELMVVVLIIAILIAIAVPTFLSARESAQDSQAKANLKNAMTNADVLFTDNESYLAPDLAGSITALQTAEPSLTWVTGSTESTSAKEISTELTANTATMVAKSTSGKKCYVIQTVKTGTTAGTHFGSNSVSTTNCSASTVAAPTGDKF